METMEFTMMQSERMKRSDDRSAEIMDGSLWLETGNPFREVEEILPTAPLHEKPERRGDKKETQLRLF